MVNFIWSFIEHFTIYIQEFIYTDRVEVSPIILELHRSNIFFLGIASMYFFIEFSFPWIIRWSVEVHTNINGFPWLKRIFYINFWNKLFHKNSDGSFHGQDIIEIVKSAIDKYKKLEALATEAMENSPFSQITKKFKIRKGLRPNQKYRLHIRRK